MPELCNFGTFRAKRTCRAIILTIAVGLLLTMTYMMPGFAAARPEDLMDKAAPSFVVTDLNGTRINIDELGKVVLIDFWATWCGPCREITPVLISLYKTYSDQGLVIVGISVDDTQKKAKEYVESNGIPYSIIAGTSKGDTPLTKIIQDYGIRAIPTLMLVDGKGIVRHVSVGIGQNKAKFEKDLGELIANLLKE